MASRRYLDDDDDATTSVAASKKPRSIDGNFAEAWKAMYAKLLQYKNMHGHCLVPYFYKGDPELGYWVSTQRTLKKQGKLSPEQATKLDSIGFPWSVQNREESFDSMCDRLIAYKEEHGHCKVPLLYKPDLALGIWVCDQRRFKEQGRLLPELVIKLDSIGFAWSFQMNEVNRGEPFDTTCKRLIAYKKENGNCEVPRLYQPDLALGFWVHENRELRKEGKLLPEQVIKLDSIGFSWLTMAHANAPQAKFSFLADNNAATSVSASKKHKSITEKQDEAWKVMYARMLQYKGMHGHCKVPESYKNDAQLGHWVQWQRSLKKKGKLLPERAAKLDSIGFAWSAKKPKESFDSMCNRLVAYKREHGHCNVPLLYKLDLTLGFWVSDQQKLRKKEKLSPEEVTKLDSIGFSWSGTARASGPQAAKTHTLCQEGSAPRDPLTASLSFLSFVYSSATVATVPPMQSLHLTPEEMSRTRMEWQAKNDPKDFMKMQFPNGEKQTIGFRLAVPPNRNMATYNAAAKRHFADVDSHDAENISSISKKRRTTSEEMAAKPKPKVWVRHFDDPDYV